MKIIQNTSKNLQKLKNSVKYKKQIKQMSYENIVDPKESEMFSFLNRQVGIKFPRILEADQKEHDAKKIHDEIEILVGELDTEKNPQRELYQKRKLFLTLLM